MAWHHSRVFVSWLRIRAFARHPFGQFLATLFILAKNRSLSPGTLVRGAPSSKTPNWNAGHATATCGNLLSVLNLCIMTKYHTIWSYNYLSNKKLAANAKALWSLAVIHISRLRSTGLYIKEPAKPRNTPLGPLHINMQGPELSRSMIPSDVFNL